MSGKYPNVQELKHLAQEIELYSQLKTEYGADGVAEVVADIRRGMSDAVKSLKSLSNDSAMAKQEPDALEKIRAQRPKGPRRMWQEFDAAKYRDKIEGALLGRMAANALGAPVEFYSIARMKALAEENGAAFPPTDYWSYVPEPKRVRYLMSPREDYTRGGMDGVPADDDIAYTLLGLLIVEEYGKDFTTDDLGKAWLKYLPMAYTAEDITLKNLKKGIPATKAGNRNNPYCEWIGADIRSDPWGYMAPGWPEKAAALAYRDAFISHRRQGIYGEMYFAACVAAAFDVEDPVEALRVGLTEIPRQCALAKAVRWALKVAPEIKNYQDARDAVETKFVGMSKVHTINNACLTIWGITIGGCDYSKVIGETVAMGMDNDCTAATAGSIVGAVVGKKGIPAKWNKGFNNKIITYLNGKRRFSISGVLKRFEKQARSIHDE